MSGSAEVALSNSCADTGGGQRTGMDMATAGRAALSGARMTGMAALKAATALTRSAARNSFIDMIS